MFTRAEAVQIKDELDEAIKQVLASHGLEQGHGGVKYGADLTIKLVLTKADASSKDETFDRYAGWYSLPAGLRGRTFEHGGRTFAIRSFNPNARRRPIVAADLTGREFLFEINAVVQALRLVVPGFPLR